MNEKNTVIFWGAGSVAKKTFDSIKKIPENLNILGFVDIAASTLGERFCGYPVFSPNQITTMMFDYIIIMSENYYEEIYDMLTYWFHIEPHKIKQRLYLLQCMLRDKYCDMDDKEIQSILKYWQSHEMSVYNQYLEEGKEINEVYWDCIENMPYIIFEDKRMYYPCNYKFPQIEGKKVVLDLMCEQQPSSPHLYIKDGIKINKGDIIADAGVCEGNFALKYVEEVSKIYLFECSREWLKPLEKTFEKFKEKVVLCNKFIGRCDTDNSVSLDSIVNGRLDFLKMDIEGYEVEALIGARQTLINNNVKCAICSYHRVNDEYAISDILNAYNYKTCYSNGYMVFYLDENIWCNPTFRRGIVYGNKM